MSDVRLIDANALMKNIGKIPQLRGITYGRMKNAVEETPTIDAVPVVRCRECKHFVKYDDDYHDVYHCDGYCEKIAYIMDGYYHGAENRNADDFCSLGEKMDGGASDDNQ